MRGEPWGCSSGVWTGRGGGRIWIDDLAVTIRRTGLACDGVTDDTAKPQALLDDASPGDWTTWLLVDSMGIVDEGDLGEWNNGWGPQPVHIEEINETPTDSEEEAP